MNTIRRKDIKKIAIFTSIQNIFLIHIACVNEVKQNTVLYLDDSNYYTIIYFHIEFIF